MSASDQKVFGSSLGSTTVGTVSCRVLTATAGATISGGALSCAALTASGLITANGGILMGDADSISVGTVTGSQIGTTAAQKLAFYGELPDVQPTTGIVAAAFVANTSAIADDTATFGGYTVGQVVAALQRLGLLA